MKLRTKWLYGIILLVFIYVILPTGVNAAVTNCPLVIYSDYCRDYIYEYSPDYNWTYVVPGSFQGEEVTFKYLVVAGGGDGGLANQPPLGQTWGYGGGGGAGGLLYNENWTPIVGEIYNIFPGRGRENSTMYNASHENITAVRGGDGGFGEIDLEYGEPGKNGGSGSGAGSGGSGGYPPWQNRTGGGTGIPGQGFDGGFSFGGYALTMAGGGGGAGGPGGNGVGGPGRTLNITFTNYTFSEGGEGETAILAPCKTTYGSGGRGWWQPQVGDTCRFGNPGIIIIQECYYPTNTKTSTLAPPKLVQFTVRSATGAPIIGATVAIQGITTTAGTWDWLKTMLRIPLDEAPIHNTMMSGTTDSLGNIEFLMVPTVKYNISTSMDGFTFPVNYIVPHDTEYMIFADSNGTESGWVIRETLMPGTRSIVVTSSVINSTAGTVTLHYNDTGLTTTGGFINITSGETLLYSIPATNDVNVTKDITIAEGGTSVLVSAKVLTTGDDFNEDHVVDFSGTVQPLSGTFESNILMYAGMGIIFFTTTLAGFAQARHVAAAMVIEAWSFLSFGWFQPIVNSTGIVSIYIVFVVGTFLVVLWNFREGLAQELSEI